MGNGSFGVGFPLCCTGKTFEGGVVGINVVVLHSKLHQLVVHVLGFSGILPGQFKMGFEFVPKGLVILTDQGASSRIDMFLEFPTLGINPVFDKGSFDIGKGGECHGRVVLFGFLS
jgi:hypothetical protein